MIDIYLRYIKNPYFLLIKLHDYKRVMYYDILTMHLSFRKKHTHIRF